MANKKKVEIIEKNETHDISDKVKTLILLIGWIGTAIALVIVLLVKKVPKLDNGSEVVASIDGYELTANDLYDNLRDASGYYVLTDLIDNFIAKKEITDTTKAYEYADSYIESFKIQYEKAGNDFDAYIKSTGKKLEDIRESIAMTYLVDMAARNYIKSEITDKEINAYYKDNIYEELTVRHILIKTNVSKDATNEEKSKAKAEALKKSNEILAKYKNGEKFEDLAKTYSEDTGTKDDGGLYANFNKTNTDAAFFKAAYALKDGEVTSSPVLSEYGYHIILKVGNNEKPKLENVKEEILKGILDNKIKKDSTLIDKSWVKLREKYNLQIFDTKLNETYKVMAENTKNKKATNN